MENIPQFIAKLLLGFLIGYALIMLAAYFQQRALIYLPSKLRPIPKEWGMSDIQEIKLKTKDGLTLLSWYKPAEKGQPTFLYFQGNAGHIGLRSEIVRPYLEKGYGVLLLGYRGYNNNPGKPSEQGFYLDADAAWNFLTKQTSSRCIILFGESLGTGVAIEMAKQRQAGALVLIAPYTSMTELGSYHYPYLPVNYLLKDRFDSAAKIVSIKIPLLVLLAENDFIIPPYLSRNLFAVANPPKEIFIYKNIGHNELPKNVQQKVIEFIDGLHLCKSH